MLAIIIEGDIMKKYIIDEETAHKLIKMAQRDDFQYGGDDADFNPQDYSGGNFDDTYAMGVSDGWEDGKTELSAEIVAKMEVFES